MTRSSAGLGIAGGEGVMLVTHDIGEAIALSDRVLVVSRSPGRLQKEIPVDLPRPRSVRQLQKDARFHELRASVWKSRS